MSTDLGVVIKIDAPGVASTISGTEQQLSRLEAKGPAISQALSKGLSEGATAAEKLGKATSAAATPFDGLVAALKREHDMLTQIQAPVQRYTQDLQTLDSLLEKNKISTEQYAAEVAKLNKALGEKPSQQEEAPNASERLEGGVGFASGLLGGGIAAEFTEIGKQIGEIVEEGQRLRDEYVEMSNAALRFAGGARTTDDVLAEQSELAEKLHSTFKPTIELYARVKEGSDELGLSHEQQIRMTQTLGEAVQLSNLPLEAASGLMAKFSFAMQTGHLETRQLQTIMREVPAIADVWKDKFGLSAGAIVAAVSKGRISVRDLSDALAENGAAVDKMFAKHQATNEVLKQETLESLKLYAAQHDLSFSQALVAQKLDELAPKSQTLSGYLKQLQQSFEDSDAQMKRAQLDADELLASFANAADTGVSRFATAMTDLGRQLGVLTDAWEGELSANQKVIKAEMEHASAVGKAKQELATLRQELKDHVVTNEEYRTKSEQLLNTIEGGMSAIRKVLHDIDDPLRTWREDLDALDALMNSGRITAAQYTAELDKLAKSAPPDVQGERAATSSRIDAALRRHALAAAGTFDPNSSGFLGGNLDTGGPAAPFQLPTADPNAQRALELYNTTRTAAEKYKDEIAEVNRLSALGNINDEAKARILDDLSTKFGKIRSPSEEYARALKDLNDKTAAGLVSETAYSEALDQLNIKYGKGDFATGLRQGVRDLAKEMDSSASLIGKVMKDTVDGINKNIGEMVTKGKADFSGLAKTIESELVQIALKKAESGLFSSLMGGGLGGTTVGAAALGGGATGGDFDIPHAASGGAWVARQQSGADTHLAMFHVRAGENVQIRTPEQVAAGQNGAQPVIQNHQRVVVQHDQRALLDTLDSPDGHTMFVKLAMANRGVIKAIAQ